MRVTFGTVCAFELGLGGLAWLGAWLVGREIPMGGLTLGRVALGGLAALPPLAFLWWLTGSQWRWWREVRAFLEAVVRPWFAGWPVWQFAVVSAVAGVAEEALFRAGLQGGLHGTLGALGAWGVASILFGLVHWLTPGYLVAATVVGAWFGGLWWLTGSLWVPAVAHAVYDCVALLWLMRRRRGGGGTLGGGFVPRSGR